MLAFSLGTVPLMLGLGSFIGYAGENVFCKGDGDRRGSEWSCWALRCCPREATVRAFTAEWNGTRQGSRCMQSPGEAEPDTSASETNDLGATAEDGVQIIESTLTGGRYPNITVTAGFRSVGLSRVPKGA